MTFKPMRSVAPDYEKFPLTFPKLMSPKLDGIRLCKYQGNVVTKSGKQIPNLFVRNWCNQHLPEGFDGELIVGDPNLDTTYNTTFRGVMTIAGDPDFRFYVFDLIGDAGAEKRLEQIHSILYYNPQPRIIPVQQCMVHNLSDVDRLYNEFLEQGYEGAILKNPEGLYKFGRSTPKCQTQLKLKPEEDFDAQVVAFEEAMHNGNVAFVNEVGETDRSTHKENLSGLGMVGGIWVRDKEGKEFKISPGKLTHPERVQVWQNKESLIGHWLKYRSMTYGVKDAPRHGRFLCWRDVSDV
jgi:DNA ligase 1